MFLPVVYLFGSILIVSLVSLIGIITLPIQRKALQSFLIFFVSFSAGTLLGDAFIHLIPEATKQIGIDISVPLTILFGIVAFFVLEKFIHWRHCHIPNLQEHHHPFVYMNLVGDGFHNFLDGLLIGGSYLVSIPVGIATTLAVIFHEIPQEISDFGVLIHGGLSKRRAIFFNFLSASFAFLGAALSIAIGIGNSLFTSYLLPFTAGGFIYIASSDLIPELHKERTPWKSALQLVSLLLGIGVMLLLLLLFEG